MLTSILSESDLLVRYVTEFICDRNFYYKHWREQIKATGFITQWLKLNLPIIHNKLKTNDPAAKIPGGQILNLLQILVTMLNEHQDMYNCRQSNNTTEALNMLKGNFEEQFG